MTPRELIEKWRAMDHSEYGGVFADELEAALRSGAPTPSQELCDVCERPITNADVICCPHCGTKWAEPFPGKAARSETPQPPSITFAELHEELCKLPIYIAARYGGEDKPTNHGLAFRREDVSALLAKLAVQLESPASQTPTEKA